MSSTLSLFQEQTLKVLDQVLVKEKTPHLFTNNTQMMNKKAQTMES